MSQILCGISGIYFPVPYTPKKLKLTAREVTHPIFAASYSQLAPVIEDWQDGNLDPTESYLLYLALFNSTELIDFRLPAMRGDKTDAVVAANMMNLVEIVDKIHTVSPERAKTKFLMPRYVVGPETRTLGNSKFWISNWNSCYNEYMADYKSSTLLDKLRQKEEILEALLKDKTRDISSYAIQLASWTALAADFKGIDCIVADGTHNDRPILLSEYWKRIIVTAAKRTNIYEIHDGDLSELIEYLEDNIEIASSGIFGHAVLSLLRATQKTRENYFSLSDIDLSPKGTVYKILDPAASTEDANLQVLIDNAPLYEPRITDYPNRLAYLKAKAKWDLAARYKQSQAIRDEMANEIKSEVNDAISPNTSIFNSGDSL